MPKKKESPIDSHRTKDVKELRTYLWSVVDDPQQATKDRNEASKQLAKLHGALLAARPAPKPVDKPKEEKEKDMTLTPEEQEAVDSALNLNEQFLKLNEEKE